MKHESKQASEGESKPTPRLRLKLATVQDVRRELARLYRDGRSGRKDVQDVSRLANILQILAHIIQGSEFERRLEALEERREQDAADTPHKP